MTLKELKNWVNSLSDEFSEYSVVNGEIKTLNTDNIEYRIDKPVTVLTIDRDTKEIVILNEVVPEKINSERW